MLRKIKTLFFPSELLESDKLHLFLISGGTRIDDNKYVESIETPTELIFYTEKQMYNISTYLFINMNSSVYFDIKRYLHFKNNSYDVNIDFFL